MDILKLHKLTELVLQIDPKAEIHSFEKGIYIVCENHEPNFKDMCVLPEWKEKLTEIGIDMNSVFNSHIYVGPNFKKRYHK